MKELIGKTIKEMYVNQDQHFLKFVTDQGDLLYYADGDCYSESWFADIVFNGYRFDFNSMVNDVVELEIPTWVKRLVPNDKRTRQDYDEVYGYNITTDNKGECTIIYRNSSNGCYGGSCIPVTPENSWVNNFLEDVQWTRIESDWSA